MLKNLGKKQKIELTITSIGIIFLLFLVIGNAQKAQKKKMSMLKTDSQVASSMSAPVFIEGRKVEESAIRQDWARDPFSSATSVSASAGLEGLVLNGIMWDSKNPLAIINSEVVKVGDELHGMKVAEITEKSVVLEYEGKEYTLDLNIQ